MLDEFIEWYYSDEHPRSYPNGYTASVQADYRKMFYDEHDEGRPLISGSNLGDPLAVLALKKMGYKTPRNPLSNLDRNFLYTGYEVEARVISMLKAYGLTIEGEQAEVEYRGYKGHMDGVIQEGIVFDVKAVRSSSFNRMTGKRPYISERYKTQLAFYRAAQELSNSCLIVYNRDTSDIAIIDLSNDSETLEELNLKIDDLEKDWTLEDLWALEEELIPVPPFEIYKGSETGNYLLPDEMRFTGYAEAFYHLAEGVNGYGREQVYVLGYKSLEEAKETLESWKAQS